LGSPGERQVSSRVGRVFTRPTGVAGGYLKTLAKKANCDVFLWRNSRSCWVELSRIATVEFASREASIRPCEHGP